jgi:Calcium binding
MVMSIVFYPEVARGRSCVLPSSHAENLQKQRIRAALGLAGQRLPAVSAETLSHYYRFLASEMSLPFMAFYPQATGAQEEIEHTCMVLELLDPAGRWGDEFDGIFCKVRKAGSELVLPLIELELPHNCSNYRLVEDYWFWFWNWR